MVPWWRVAVFAAFALPITVIDLRWMRIPDALSLGGIAVAAAITILSPGFSAIELALEALIGFGVFWAIAVATGGKLGLGDAKYSALIALSLGLYGWLSTIAVASVTGLAAGLVLVLCDRVPLFLVPRLLAPSSLAPNDTRIPFAPFLTFGAVVSIGMQRLYPGGLLP
jgi:prepilin signal peptidase PulO-like enzyme (type II secretory pathway)